MGVTMHNDQYRALRDEAATAGDADQVALCDLALSGDPEAEQACDAAIAEAQAHRSERE
jgi:hypothetical protein